MLLNRCEYVAWVSRSFWWAASTLRRTAILHCWKMRNNRKIPPQTPIHVFIPLHERGRFVEKQSVRRAGVRGDVVPEQYRIVEDGLYSDGGVKGNVARLLALQHCVYGSYQPVGIFVFVVYVTSDHAAALESRRTQREQRYGRTGDDLERVGHDFVAPGHVLQVMPRGEEHAGAFYVDRTQRIEQLVYPDLIGRINRVFYAAVLRVEQFREVVFRLPVDVACVVYEYEPIHAGQYALHQVDTLVEIGRRIKQGQIVPVCQCPQRYLFRGRNGKPFLVIFIRPDKILFCAYDGRNAFPYAVNEIAQQRRRGSDQHQGPGWFFAVFSQEVRLEGLDFPRGIYQQQVYMLGVEFQVFDLLDARRDVGNNASAPRGRFRIGVDDQYIIALVAGRAADGRCEGVC